MYIAELLHLLKRSPGFQKILLRSHDFGGINITEIFHKIGSYRFKVLTAAESSQIALEKFVALLSHAAFCLRRLPAHTVAICLCRHPAHTAAFCLRRRPAHAVTGCLCVLCFLPGHFQLRHFSLDLKAVRHECHDHIHHRDIFHLRALRNRHNSSDRTEHSLFRDLPESDAGKDVSQLRVLLHQFIHRFVKVNLLCHISAYSNTHIYVQVQTQLSVNVGQSSVSSNAILNFSEAFTK